MIPLLGEEHMAWLRDRLTEDAERIMAAKKPKHEATHGWRNPPSIYPEDNACLEFDLRKLPR